jgi:hypothetical protein
MKEEGHCLSSRSWLLSWWHSGRARLASIAPSTSASLGFWRRETKPCAPSARKRPSFYLLAASLFLLVSAALSLWEKPPSAPAGPAAALLERGWRKAESLPCPTVPGRFYELEGDGSAAEAFALGRGEALVSRPLAIHPVHCREIEQPHFVEEIE